MAEIVSTQCVSGGVNFVEMVALEITVSEGRDRAQVGYFPQRDIERTAAMRAKEEGPKGFFESIQ